MFICSRMLYCSYCYRIRSRQKEWSGLCNRRSTFQVLHSFHANPCGIIMTCNCADSVCICVCEALEILESSGIKLIERVEIWKLQVTVRLDQLAVAVLRACVANLQPQQLPAVQQVQRKLQRLQWNGWNVWYSWVHVHISFVHSIWPVVRDVKETSVYMTYQIMPGKETSVYMTYHLSKNADRFACSFSITYQILPISSLALSRRRMHHPSIIWSDFTMHKSNQQTINQMRRQSNNHLRCLRFTFREFSEWTLRHVHIISHKHEQHESPSGEPYLKNMWYRLQSLGIQFAKQTTIFA